MRKSQMQATINHILLLCEPTYYSMYAEQTGFKRRASWESEAHFVKDVYAQAKQQQEG